MSDTTIAAIATPNGVGGIGTLRISGPDAIAVADRVFRSMSGDKLEHLPGYTARYGRVIDGETVLDDAVALVFRAPKSYTGENVVEITVHGGLYVTKAALRALLGAGAVLAGPGEFTKRAFLNGKMDLAEAEAVMGIISADGERALRASRAAADGAVTKKLSEIKETLLFAAATITAFTDFPDEEPSFSGIDRLPELLTSAQNALADLLRHYDAGKVLREGVRTALVGRTNVGKSTLMNLLVGAERSIVTEVAGTTRDVIEETVRLGEIKLCLSDTAGLRETEDAVEKIGVDRSRAVLDQAELILFVTDASRDLEPEEKELLASLAGRSVIVIQNKTDLAAPQNSSLFEGLPTVSMAAKNGVGLAALEQAVLDLTGASVLTGDEVILGSERQRAAAERAQNEVRAAIETLTAGYTVDAVGTCLDSALEAVLELTGEAVTTEVADEVFRKFCVGK